MFPRFETQNQQIQFHNFNVQVAYNGPIGGKVEASFGDDANIINSYPKGVFAPNTDIDITQAYVSGTVGPLTGIVGKFETLAGAEVIESPNDLNISRSILFGYAVPFTHTGGRLTWTTTSDLSLIFGINKGWDTTRSLYERDLRLSRYRRAHVRRRSRVESQQGHLVDDAGLHRSGRRGLRGRTASPWTLASRRARRRSPSTPCSPITRARR